ncbi:MAG: bifunctional UDP-N-acetylglucosamine diphosphorylase/glucosamine-1-phosphate N-acetyltransferase GlmU [gamma proteobacterium symbiont of Bathyaustriella thionipta]|nr:bifunctional UDP-N-acetylglucosamine diphosphorylase/glucosamine-1-phosphate N-acetyltransferase GlmU [gamma proteobacterium symbiont of Bathyaustriella thionipta]
MKSLGIIILAAGKGTRMRSARAKVLHELAGQPLLQHVLQTARSLNPQRILVVHGHQSETVINAFADEDIHWVLQTEQKGTGHAVQLALAEITDCEHILVLYADVPLISTTFLNPLLAQLESGSLSILTAQTTQPRGYGRIVRSRDGQLQAIIEEKDCSDKQRQITEINSGILAAHRAVLRRWLEQLDDNNTQKEFYLTDVVRMAVVDAENVQTVLCNDMDEVSGVNDRSQLSHLERVYQNRQAQQIMRQGVTLMDPARFDVRGELQIQEDVVIEPNVLLQGKVSIGRDVHIESNCIIRNSRIGDGVTVRANSLIEDSTIDDDCSIGPFARLRPGTQLASGVHVGNFVEIKNSHIQSGSKINHLSYIGDTDMGKAVNIGAGCITCNYDGAYKHRTHIGDHVFVGSDTQLIAPLRVEDGATIGAGSTISKDAPANKLTLSRAKQVTVSGWQRPAKDKS